MTTAMNRRHRKRCKALSTRDLFTLITTLEPAVKETSSLLECARNEYKRRLREKKREEDH